VSAAAPTNTGTFLTDRRVYLRSARCHFFIAAVLCGVNASAVPLVLKPVSTESNGDWSIVSATLAHEALQRDTTQPTDIPLDRYIQANGPTTNAAVVRLTAPSLGGHVPGSSRAWFFGDFDSTANVTVEALRQDGLSLGYRQFHYNINDPLTSGVPTMAE